MNRQGAQSDVEWLEEFVGTALDQLTEEDVSAAREILEEMGEGALDGRAYNAVSAAEKWIEGYWRYRNAMDALDSRRRMERRRDYLSAMQTLAECLKVIQASDAPRPDTSTGTPTETPETLRMMNDGRLNWLANQADATTIRLLETIAELESQRATFDKALAGEVRKRATSALNAELSAKRAALKRCRSLSEDIAADFARRREERAEVESVQDRDATLLDLKRRVAELEAAR